jgi:hypothetical protein
MKISLLFSILFATFIAHTQTPSTYPYFNRIHTVSDSVHPNFWNFFYGGVLLENDTILLTGIEFDFTSQTYNRTFEFINPNNGDVVFKKTENTYLIPGTRSILGYSNGNLYAFSRDLGVQSIKKFSNPYENEIWNKVPDAYPFLQDPDNYSEAIHIQKNGSLICYGQSPNGKMLMSLYDTSLTLISKTDFSSLLSNNSGSITEVTQLQNNSYLIKANTPYTFSMPSTARIFILNEDLSWKQQLYSTDQNTSSSCIQGSDSCIYCFGLKDTIFNISNSSYTSYIYKFDQDGNAIWKKQYPINYWMQQSNWTSSWMMSGIELKSGNLVFIGNDLFKGEDGDFQQVNGEPSLQIRLLCIDSSGSIIWERSHYTSKNNSTVVHDAILLSQDDIILFGGIQESLVYGLEQKAFVAKVNCIGRMTDLMHDVQINEQDGLVSIQIEADSFYETTIDWGDGATSTNFQTAYSDSSELFLAQHLYAQSQPYQITVSTRGCKDTLVYELVQEAHVPDNNDAELSMFPNPTLGFFKIKIPTNELLNLEVTDAFGKLVYQFKDVSLFTGFDVDLTMQPVGQYHIRITGKARSWVGKVVKI